MDTWHHLTSCKKPAPCALRLKVRVNRWCIHGCSDRLHKTTSIHEEDLPILPQRQETTWQLKSREDSLRKNCRWCTCLDGSSWWFIHVLSHHQTKLSIYIYIYIYSCDFPQLQKTTGDIGRSGSCRLLRRAFHPGVVKLQQALQGQNHLRWCLVKLIDHQHPTMQHGFHLGCRGSAEARW